MDLCHDFTAMQGAKAYKFNKKNRVTCTKAFKAVPVAVRIMTAKNGFPLPSGESNLSRSVVLDLVMALGLIDPIQIHLIHTSSCPEKCRITWIYSIPLF